MLQIVTEAGVLQDFAKAIDRVTNETIIEVDDHGLRVVCSDASTAIILEATVPKDTFEAYEAKGEYELGVSLDYLKTALKPYDKDEEVLVKDEAGGELTLEGDRAKSHCRLFDTETMKRQGVKELDFAGFLVLDGADFVEAVKVGGMGGSRVAVTAGPDRFHVETEDGMSKMEYTVLDDEFEEASTLKEEVTSVFGMEYLTKATATLSGDHPVRVGMGPKFPMGLWSRLDSGIQLRYMLAPHAPPVEDS